MNNVLELILRCAVLESEGGDEQVIIDAFQNGIGLLLSRPEIFQTTPERLFTNGSLAENMRFPDDWAELASLPAGNLYFPKRAVLLHDAIYSAINTWEMYVYRSRGARFFLFEDGTLFRCGTYATIDNHGFGFRNEGYWEPEHVRWIDEPEYLRTHYFNMFRSDPNSDEKIFVCEWIIRIICNIKAPIRHTFATEYLFTPPDVDVLSDFSLAVREKFWDICLSNHFEHHYGSGFRDKCIRILTTVGVTPQPEHILSYAKRAAQQRPLDLATFLAKMTEMEQLFKSTLVESLAPLHESSFWKRIFEEQEFPLHSDRYANKILSTRELEEVVDEIIAHFKDIIETKGIWKELWNGALPKHEKTSQNLFFTFALSYCRANNIDLSPESDSGNGPVDFKLSHGHAAKVVVEFKLSTNPSLINGYSEQLETYKKADDTNAAVYLIVDVGGIGNKLQEVLKLADVYAKQHQKSSKVVVIDGTRKLSASKRKRDGK